MSLFLDLRLQPVGGGLAGLVSTNQGTSIGDYTGLNLNELLAVVQGRHLLIAAHGFNVNRANGIASLSNWNMLLQLPQPNSAFLGLLWPGDSIWAHGLDYPAEPKIADEAGSLAAKFIDANFQGAASISFASHSLGARVVLATISHMNLPVRRLTLMAPAIDDNCLATEFKSTAAKIGSISVLASKKDEVLSAAFPLGNFFAGIIAAGHPWWRAALGHCGPDNALADELSGTLRDSGRLEVRARTTTCRSTIRNLRLCGSPWTCHLRPRRHLAGIGWQESFSSAFASTRFR